VSKFQLVLRCRACHYKYKRIVTALSEEEVSLIPDPPCPKCAKKVRRTDIYETSSAPVAFEGIDLSKQTAPGIVGANKIVKAVDKTAEIVMADHHLTDLKSNIREGESMAPRLPGGQQKMADNFFGGHNMMGPAKSLRQKKLQAAVRGALAGRNRATSIDIKSVLPDSRVALRSVGQERINL
jgi:hypothetical protein